MRKFGMYYKGLNTNWIIPTSYVLKLDSHNQNKLKQYQQAFKKPCSASPIRKPFDNKEAATQSQNHHHANGLQRRHICRHFPTDSGDLNYSSKCGEKLSNKFKLAKHLKVFHSHQNNKCMKQIKKLGVFMQSALQKFHDLHYARNHMNQELKHDIVTIDSIVQISRLQKLSIV